MRGLDLAVHNIQSEVASALPHFAYLDSHACLQVFGLGIGFGAPRGVGVGGGAVWAPERAVGSLPCQPLWHIYDAKIA